MTASPRDLPLPLPPRKRPVNHIALTDYRPLSVWTPLFPSCLIAALTVVFVGLVASPAQAQLYESVGIRAQGMSGAFVAVSDDSTTTWWNPAGLAAGPFFNATVERRSARNDTSEGTLGVSLAVPSLGLSYYRLRIGAGPPSGSTGLASADRQDQGTTGTHLSTYVLSQFGVTVGQSLGEHLVAGSTLKLVQADQTRGDLDLGVMGTLGPARVAAVVKNLVDADLTAGGLPASPRRQVRVGAAYFRQPGRAVSLVAAVDADLTRSQTAWGDERHLAGGIELWVKRRLGVRGGAGLNTVGNARRSFSGGASAAIRGGFYVDAQVTQGDDEATKGWGFAIRATF